MVRTRVMQALFAYDQNEGKTQLTARKELLSSFASTYSLYMVLLELINETTRYAEQQLEEENRRAKITHREYTPNRRFVENRFAKQMFENRALRHYIDEQRLSWDTGMDAVHALYKSIIGASFYKEYMQKEEVTYADDRRIWKKIFEYLVPECASLPPALDEMEVRLDQTNWATDMEVVATYVVKTIKSFQEDSSSDHPLLEMFANEEELAFGTQLLQYAIEKGDEYAVLIEKNLKNWEADRIAYMDKVILRLALAEILNFPEIALEVSLNEYLEMAKEYSTEKSHLFINGILDVILKGLKAEDAMVKNIR